MDKASGEDKIPPRLAKMASNFLSEPITDIINTAVDTNTFPDRAKRAFAIPIDEGGNDQHLCNNYRPVNLLNTFSKFIELTIFSLLQCMEPLFINFCINLSQSVPHSTYLWDCLGNGGNSLTITKLLELSL